MSAQPGVDHISGMFTLCGKILYLIWFVKLHWEVGRAVYVRLYFFNAIFHGLHHDISYEGCPETYPAIDASVFHITCVNSFRTTLVCPKLSSLSSSLEPGSRVFCPSQWVHSTRHPSIKLYPFSSAHLGIWQIMACYLYCWNFFLQMAESQLKLD